MDALLQIAVTGLTLGSMYALASVGLALTYGTMGMFNMAHGVFMTIGAYAAYAVATIFAGPTTRRAPRRRRRRRLERRAPTRAHRALHATNRRFPDDDHGGDCWCRDRAAGCDPEAVRRLSVQAARSNRGSFCIANTAITYQSIVILITAAVSYRRRCVATDAHKIWPRDPSHCDEPGCGKADGRPHLRIYLQVIVIAGVLAAAAGILFLRSPAFRRAWGSNPLIRAFIICVVAGLGSVTGAGVAAIVLGLFEAAIGYYLGVRYGLPVMLGLVIIVLIFRPAGLFGRLDVVRS